MAKNHLKFTNREGKACLVGAVSGADHHHADLALARHGAGAREIGGAKGRIEHQVLAVTRVVAVVLHRRVSVRLRLAFLAATREVAVLGDAEHHVDLA